MKKIFMVCYGGGHAQIIKEVYKNLIDIPNIQIVILALTMSKYIFDRDSIPYKQISDYYDEENEKEIYNLGKNFCIKNNIDTLIGEKETYLYHGYSLFELEKKYGEKKVDEGFKKLGRRIFLPLSFMKKIIEKEAPNLVITTNSPRFEKAALIVSKEMQIKTLSIEDLFGVEDERMSKEVAAFFNDQIYENVYGDYLCIISEESKKNLTVQKINKIFITGNPSFDKALKLFLSGGSKEEVKDITICFLSQNRPEKFLLIEELVKIIERKSNYNLIIKIHPNEKKEEYLKKLNKKIDKVIVEDSNLYTNILRSNIIITIDSTSALEAAVLDKPIIAKRNDLIPFKEMNLGMEYENIDELEGMIEKILNDKKVKEDLSNGRKMFRPKRFAGKTIKEIVKNIILNMLLIK